MLHFFKDFHLYEYYFFLVYIQFMANILTIATGHNDDSKQKEAANMSGKNTKTVTLFIVDDDDVDVLGIERALKKLKIANPTIRAKDGVEALEMLRQGKVPKPFITLLDINMPRMSGIEMLSELRTDPKLFDTVVFILTTSHDDKDKFEAYKKNVAGYIVKKKVGEAFLSIVEMLGNYWRIVELPDNE